MQTAKEFYEFFEKIPGNKWCRRAYERNDQHCGMGFLVCAPYDSNTHTTWPLEAHRLYRLFMDYLNVSPMDANDDLTLSDPPNPRQNMLDALQAISEMGG